MKRIVITGLGVVAPNGTGMEAFQQALQKQVSGIRFDTELDSLAFACKVSGRPQITEAYLHRFFDDITLRFLVSSGVRFGIMAGMEAWRNAGLPETAEWKPRMGCILGSGLSGVEAWREAIYTVDNKNVRRLGSRVVEQTMPSGAAAYLGGKYKLGNQVTANSAACATGTEALILAAERIQSGKADLMLAGSTDSWGPYIWGGFDSMRVMSRRYTETPEQASRPMNAQPDGFVPGSGAGAFVLESLEHAQARDATIYAEYLGGFVNSGGQVPPGSMTAPNPDAVRICILEALRDADIAPEQVDLISGHLTATMGDVLEIQAYAQIFQGEKPWVNSLKGYTGHCLAAAGSVELVATCLQLQSQFVLGNANATPVHPEILSCWEEAKIPVSNQQVPVNYALKTSFGFGDVNAACVLKAFA